MASKPLRGYTEEYIHELTKEAFQSLDYDEIMAVANKQSKCGNGFKIGFIHHLLVDKMRSLFGMTEREAALALIGSACAVLAATKEKQRTSSNN